MTSIFGDLDLSSVPDDPWFTAAGTYWAFCTDALMKENDSGQLQLIFSWTIDEPDNDYHGNTLKEYYSLFPGKKWEDYTPDEKKVTKFLKRRLRRGFDLSEEQINTVSPSDLQGNGAFITVKANEGKGDNAGRKFSNVQDAVCKRVFDEEREQLSESASNSSFGL